MDKENIKKEIERLDKKISMRYAVNNLKIKSFKKVQLTIKLATLALASAFVGAGINSHINKGNDSSIYSSIKTTDLYSAEDEVIVDYVKSSFSDLSDYVSEDMNSNDIIESINVSYYSPVLESYTDYKETNDEKYHDNFIDLAKKYEDRVITYNSNLSFDNSIYKYAKYIDGSVCIPYSKVIDNSTLPEGYKVDNNIVYIPIDVKDAKTLGND